MPCHEARGYQASVQWADSLRLLEYQVGQVFQARCNIRFGAKHHSVYESGKKLWWRRWRVPSVGKVNQCRTASAAAATT